MKIHIIGQFAPPINGLSLALEKIKTSPKLNSNFSIKYTDIKNNKKILKHMNEIIFSDCDIYYFTISQSKFGNLRDLIMIFFMLLNKKKIVIHYHGGYFKGLYKSVSYFQKKLNKLIISKVDRVIVLSKGLKYLFDDVISPNKIIVCENFVEDSSLISNNLFNYKLNERDKKKSIKILYLSNMIESKGYFELLKAINHINLNEKLKVDVTFAGGFYSKVDEINFHNYVSINSMNNINYVGVINGEEKKKKLLKSDMFILPTKYPKEGQPISILEAMASGCYVISTNHAGIPEIINNEMGCLISNNTHFEIVKAILDYSTLDLNEINKKLIKSRNFILDDFKEIDYVNRLYEIFEELCECEGKK